MLLAEAYDPLRSLQASWKQLWRTPLTIFLGALLPIVVQVGVVLAFEWAVLASMLASGSDAEGRLRMFSPAFVAFAIAFGIGMFLLTSWTDIGFARAVERTLSTGTDQVPVLYGGIDRLGVMLVTRLLIGIAFLALYLPTFVLLGVQSVVATLDIPVGLKVLCLLVFSPLWIAAWVYVLLGLSFVTPIVALETCGPVDAIRRSWRYARGQRWRLVWFWIVIWFLGVAGMLACCIGTLVSTPLIETMRVEAYLALKRPQLPAEPMASG